MNTISYLNYRILVALCVPCTAIAADTYWNGGTGNWTSTNWTNSEPTLSEDANINNGGTAQITSGNYEYADDLFLAQSSGQSGHISMSGGYLLVEHDQHIGYGGVGTFTQNGGENRCSYGLSNYDLHLGYESGSSGTYTMTAGTLYTGDQYIGRLGTGSFIQSGGTNNVSATGSGTADHMYIGWANSSGYGTGTYRLSGTGQLVLNHKNSNIYVGGEYSGTLPPGRFEWFKEGGISWTDPSGNGRMVMGENGTLAMGYSFSSIPTMVSGLQFATLEVTNGATVTKVNDGIISSVNYLRIGSSTGAGYGNQTGGTVQVGQAAYIGDGGAGIATQTGGNFNTTTHLYLGLGGAQGTYRLKGGTLSVGSNIFGGTGTGTMVLDGGTLSLAGSIFNVTNLVLGDEQAGSWTLGTGKTLTVTNQVVGKNFTGAFTQSGGTNNAGTLTLGQTSGSGTYLLTGGNLNVSGQVVDGTGTGTLQIDGGTFAPGGNVTVDNLKVGITVTGSHTQSANSYSVGTLTMGSGTYTLSGGSLAVSGDVVNATGTATLALNGGSFSPSGDVSVDNLQVGVNAAASHTLTAGTWQAGSLTFGVQGGGAGTLALDGGVLNVSGNVSVGTGTGTLILNGGTFNAGGSVNVGNLKLAATNDVSFTQASNSYTAGSLVLGMNAGRSGSWRLDGGTLNVASIPDSPGTGSLILNGGTLVATGDIHVDHLTVGLTNPASHVQTGYGITVANNLTLGNNSTYTLSGGSLNVTGTIGGGSGTKLTLNGGALTAGGDVTVMHLVVGDDKSGYYTQAGHTWAVGGNMTLGEKTGGYGSYALSAGTLNVTGTLAIGGGGTGRFDWQGGTLTTGGVDFGTGSSLALGFGVSMDSLANGSLFGSPAAPGHLERVSLELGRGASTQLSANLAVRDVKLGVGFGTADYSIKGGSLTVQRLEVGSIGMVQTKFTQTGGVVTVANDLVVGNMPGTSGTYQLQGGTLGGTGGLSVRPFGGQGNSTFTGYGTVALSGTLTNNGRVVANGFGQSRSLDLSQTVGVVNSYENLPGERHGWGAENGGRLILPTILIDSAGASVNWGESPVASGEFAIDLVNSAQFTFQGLAASGGLTGSLLAADNINVPALPDGYQIIGVWNFDLTTTFDSARVMFRYDDILAAQMGIIDENQLDVLHYENGVWQVVTGMRDVANNWIGTNDLTSLSPFAVGVIPEPRCLMLLALTSLALLRRTGGRAVRVATRV